MFYTYIMKIAFLSAYSGPVARGTESFVHELAHRFSLKSHDVTVFQLGVSSHNTYKTIQIPIEVDYTYPDTSGSEERKFGLDYWAMMLGRFTYEAIPQLIAFRPDIIIPVNGHWQYDIVKRYCEYSNAKLVITGQWDEDIHALEVHPDAYIALSDRQQIWALEQKFNGVLKWIPNGVNTDIFSPVGPKHVLPFNNGYKTLLTVGQFNTQKNIKTVIKAAAQIPHLNLVICGQGDEEADMRTLAQTLLPDRHAFLSLDYNQMPHLYRAVDGFALVPEKSEAFGLVYLEALASNLPVVAINDDVRRNIVSNAGVFVTNIHDTNEVKHAIETVVQTDFQDKPRIQAMNFGWDNIVQNYEKAFKNLLVK